MIQPVFRLLATQPQLLMEHAQAYAELVSTEASRLSSRWQQRTLLWVLSACFGVVAFVLAGVGAMFWAVVPAARVDAFWPLILIPSIPLVLAIACGWAARHGPATPVFAEVRQQLAADWDMLREAGEP